MNSKDQQLEDLFHEWMSGRLDVSQQQELVDRLADLDKKDELMKLMRKEWKHVEPLLQVSAEQRQKIYDRAFEPITLSSPIYPIHFLKTSWFRYAAAIIIMLGVGSYIWFNNTTPNPVNQKNPLNPSSDNHSHNKAILTLANGQQIILDSTQGNIVKQGSLTVINLAGKLKYEGIGTSTEYNTISTPKGGQYQIVLPDGSRVWLNAASSIKFPMAFIGSTREVIMTGEAYMEIEKNSKQSFIVRAHGAEVQVLGTSFNVNAYEDENAAKTTLVSGSVKVKVPNIINQRSKLQQQGVILKPGQQAIIASSKITGGYQQQKGYADLITVQTVDIQQTLAWKDGFFNLQDVSFQQVMRELERWYNIKIQYEGPIPTIKFKGKINRMVNLSDILKFLQDINVKYKMEGKILTIINQ